MELTPRIIKNIVTALKRTQPNEIDCGDCFDRLEQFAEMTLEGKSAEKALPLVQLHLEGCRDCREEFEALLDVLGGMANGRGNRVQNNKTIGRILLILGVLLLFVSLLADVVGLGLSPVFGLRQIVGSISGLALAGVGFWLMRKL